MRIYKLLSVLLEYPNAELPEHLAEIEKMIGGLEQSTPEDQQSLLNFIAWAQTLPLTELQEHYVKTFDLKPDNALYLTHHLFEEQDRARGPALVKLSEYFQAQGYTIEKGELPDYLPLLLEYVSTLPDEQNARQFLHQAVEVAALLARNLENMESPYALLLHIVERQGRLAEAVAHEAPRGNRDQARAAANQ
ncbi:MAG: nitrate reductase molybdenum cofactor assembly chaperone [Pseudomonadota bacterium]|nr:nitrate reductase molybdenum cofactor assembly chaperone [Pseudomonadota bacterium]